MKSLNMHAQGIHHNVTVCMFRLNTSLEHWFFGRRFPLICNLLERMAKILTRLMHSLAWTLLLAYAMTAIFLRHSSNVEDNCKVNSSLQAVGPNCRPKRSVPITKYCYLLNCSWRVQKPQDLLLLYMSKCLCQEESIYNGVLQLSERTNCIHPFYSLKSALYKWIIALVATQLSRLTCESTSCNPF